MIRLLCNLKLLFNFINNSYLLIFTSTFNLYFLLNIYFHFTNHQLKLYSLIIHDLIDLSYHPIYNTLFLNLYDYLNHEMAIF